MFSYSRFRRSMFSVYVFSSVYNILRSFCLDISVFQLIPNGLDLLPLHLTDDYPYSLNRPLLLFIRFRPDTTTNVFRY